MYSALDASTSNSRSVGSSYFVHSARFPSKVFGMARKEEDKCFMRGEGVKEEVVSAAAALAAFDADGLPLAQVAPMGDVGGDENLKTFDIVAREGMVPPGVCLSSMFPLMANGLCLLNPPGNQGEDENGRMPMCWLWQCGSGKRWRSSLFPSFGIKKCFDRKGRKGTSSVL